MERKTDKYIGSKVSGGVGRGVWAKNLKTENPNFLIY